MKKIAAISSPDQHDVIEKILSMICWVLIIGFDKSLSAQELRITELLAINDSLTEDEDGDHSDWLEVQNPGTSAVDLGGWFLTDDPSNLAKWRFPSQELAPGDGGIIFASGKDRPVA